MLAGDQRPGTTTTLSRGAGGAGTVRRTVLPGGLQDGCWYAIDLSVDDQRQVEFTVTPEGSPPQRARVQDRAGHPVVAGATGVLVGLGRGGGETGAWRAELRELACGWR